MKRNSPPRGAALGLLAALLLAPSLAPAQPASQGKPAQNKTAPAAKAKAASPKAAAPRKSAAPVSAAVPAAIPSAMSQISCGVAAIDTKARQALLVDLTNGLDLLSKAADERMTPSSMSKLATVYRALEEVKSGRLSLASSLPVSEKAWRMGGSKMFVEVGKTVSVDDLLHGVIIQSGNDATVVLAEGIAGSEEAFAQQLNDLAERLGMSGSHYTNASGWPEPEHYSTARDLSLLAGALIRDFPDSYPIFAQRQFVWHNIKQENRNPLLGIAGLGGDGLKTGHTQDGGYGLVGSAMQNGRRLLLVINGLSSETERREEAQRLLEWGFRATQAVDLLPAGSKLAEAPVWLGIVPNVPVGAAQPLRLLMAAGERRGVKAHFAADQMPVAPIAAGARIGRIVVESPCRPPISVPAVALDDVPKLGLGGRMAAGLDRLLGGT